MQQAAALLIDSGYQVDLDRGLVTPKTLDGQKDLPHLAFPMTWPEVDKYDEGRDTYYYIPDPIELYGSRAKTLVIGFNDLEKKDIRG